MKYIDIHTHTVIPKTQENRISFYNRIVGQETLGDLSHIEMFSVGIHPWFIHSDKSNDQLLKQLWEKAKQPEVWMIGEAGLDKLHETPLERQLYLFEQQALLAEELHKPLIIHCVKAWSELLALRKKIRPLSPWLIHGFRGKRELAEQLLKENIYLSFSEQFQSEALQIAWPTHFFLETDESKLDIQEIYEKAAAALSVSTEMLMEQIEQNFSLLFSGE